MSATLRPWRVALDFDAPAVVAAPAANTRMGASKQIVDIPVDPAEVRATVHQQSLAEALEAGRAQGLTEGFESGRNATLAETAAQTTALLERMAEFLTDARDHATRLTEGHATILAGLLRKALLVAYPSLEAQFGPGEAAAIAARLLPLLAREPNVELWLHPKAEVALRALLQPWPHAAVLTLHVDPDMSPGNLRMSWPDGEALRCGPDVWSAIIAALTEAWPDEEQPA